MKKTGWVLLFPLAMLLLYFICLSPFVQGGDTAELVLAAKHKLVVHPPGYPLWIWWQHLWISIFPFGTTFYKASVLNALFAGAVLALVSSFVQNRPLQILTVLLMGFGAAFFESAILPEVFMLHALFVTAIGGLYFFASEDSKKREFGVPFLFFLGMANHLTVVTLAPVIVHLAWRARRNKAAKNFILGAGIGAALSLGFYLSSMALDSSHPLSWRELDGLGDLFRHFIRSDYGTFSLSANDAPFSLAAFADLWKRSLLWYLPVLATAAFFVPRDIWKKPSLWAWTLSLLLSIALFLAFRVRPEGFGGEILIRFHVMPAAQAALLAAFLFSRIERGVAWIWVGALPFILNGLALLPGNLSIRNDSVIEDYALNFLKEAREHQPALIYADTDGSYFALRYAQEEFSDPNLQIGTAVYSLFFNRHFFEKLKLKLPELRLENQDRVWGERKMNLKEDLLEPNLDRISQYVVKGFQAGREFKVTFQALGRRLSRGSGVDFDAGAGPGFLLRTRLVKRPKGPQAQTRAYLYAQYSHFFLAKAAKSFAEGDKKSAVDNWNRALEIVPFAYPALENFCRLTTNPDERCSPGYLSEVAAESAGLF